MPQETRSEFQLRETVSQVVDRIPITDLHTHLFTPAFGSLLLWGVDELLTYHYLLAETLRVTKVPCDAFWSLGKREQADIVWKNLFIERTPISESCRGVLTVLNKLGLDVASRNLDDYRAWFAAQKPAAFIDLVFETANLKDVVMTNDPFDPAEHGLWMKGFDRDPRFHAALRIDPLLNDWAGACPKLKAWGYDVEPAMGATTLVEVRRFLAEWLKRMNALYMAVSLPPDFRFPEDTARSKLIAECIVPVARENNVPFAMMIGVKRNVNPALRLAGDGVGLGDVDSVARLCAEYPDNKFMVTMLARENQHELCVTARKFRNLCLFGCWWYLNDPSLIDEMTRMRFELLGLSVVPQHSDARVLDQVIYKWTHSRRIIGDVLVEKYRDVAETGWLVSEAEIERDAARLFGGNFWEFLGAQRM
jgi:hypothetical protein